MDNIEALVLGLVQAATEFLPVSSSGHLRLGEHLLGQTGSNLLFDVVLHVGTLLAVVWVFRARLMDLVLGVLMAFKTRRSNPFARMAGLIVLATIPTGLIGVLLGDWLDGLIDSPWKVGLVLIVNGFILFATRWARPAGADIDWRKALLVGTVQGLAVTRGISRSGSTIAAAMFAGVGRDTAAQFSFLLSIPAILGALVLELDLHQLTSGPGGVTPYVVGLVVSGVAGAAFLKLLLWIVRGGKLYRFAYYCWALGLAAVLWEVA